MDAKARGIGSAHLTAIHSEWFAAFSERAVLFPSLPAEEKLTSEQEHELGKAVTARKQVCCHCISIKSGAHQIPIAIV